MQDLGAFFVGWGVGFPVWSLGLRVFKFPAHALLQASFTAVKAYDYGFKVKGAEFWNLSL